jgi:hypothetical protein
MLRGAIRDLVTRQRRSMLWSYPCEEVQSNEPLPDAVV